MKKIEIEFREVISIVKTKIILVPNGFKFRELGEDDFKYIGDEDGFRFSQIQKYFYKRYKRKKLKSNEYYDEFYVHSVEEI
jgi:hypothetical protein